MVQTVETKLKELAAKDEQQQKEIDNLKKMLAASRASILNIEKREKRNESEIRKLNSDTAVIKQHVNKLSG